MEKVRAGVEGNAACVGAISFNWLSTLLASSNLDKFWHQKPYILNHNFLKSCFDTANESIYFCALTLTMCPFRTLIRHN